MSDRFLDGRVAIVTGAGRGIGRAHARRLAAYGARVVVNDTGVTTQGQSTSETPAEEVAAEIRGADGIAVSDTNDISSMTGAQALFDRALDEWGAVDIVVNNAGIGRPRMVFNLEEDAWDDVVRVHLKGTFAMSRAACRWWRDEAKAGRRDYGRLVNTSTGLLFLGGAGQSNYVAAKAGVAAFTEAVATEMQPHGVTVNTIMPGAMTRLAAIGWRIDRARETDSGRGESLRDPVHVAELVCYLASPAAGWISGQCFQVAGGRIQHAILWTEGAELSRTDRGWNATELMAEIPRLFGAGSKRPEKPPEEWAQRYHAEGQSGAS